MFIKYFNIYLHFYLINIYHYHTIIVECGNSKAGCGTICVGVIYYP
jgi:hypothetical protein